jgi:hypothetical protein
MKILAYLFFITSLQAKDIVAFGEGKLFKFQGNLEGKFFVINRLSANEQRFLIKNNHKMVDGAQYEVCLKIQKDCHLSCEANVIGLQKFITPDIDPKIFTPNENGEHAPVAAHHCP